MPRILTTCTTDGVTVPTGYRTTDLELKDASGPRAFRCPSCQQVHNWTRHNAFSERTLTLDGSRQAAA